MEYNQKTQALKEEQARLEEQSKSTVKSLEEINSELEVLDSNTLSTQQERDELLALRNDALRTRDAIRALVADLEKNFQRSKKIVDEQRKETERGVRNLAGQGSVAGFADAQFAIDFANLQAQNGELIEINSSISDMEKRLGITNEAVEEVTGSLLDTAGATGDVKDELKDAKKEVDAVEKLMKDVEDATKKAEEAGSSMTYTLERGLRDVQRALSKLKEEYQETIDKINENEQNSLASNAEGFIR